MSQKHLGAPLCSVQELQTFLALLDIKLSESAIKNPSPDNVRLIYTAVVEYVLDITMSQIIERNNVTGQRSVDTSQNSTMGFYVNEAADNLNNPELHELSVIEIELFKHM